jgi:hypothetical protein
VSRAPFFPAKAQREKRRKQAGFKSWRALLLGVLAGKQQALDTASTGIASFFSFIVLLL